jgi:hypothetical protein
MILLHFASVNLVFFEYIRDYLEPNAREQLPFGAKSTEDPDLAIHEHCSSKTPRTWEKTLPFGIPTVCTSRSSLPMRPFGQ